MFLLPGSTEATSDKVDVLCGKNGVFATAKLMGIEIKTDQKVIEVIDKRENIVDTPHLRVAPAFRSDTIEPSIHEADVNDAVQKARAAFADWSGMGGFERGQVLRRTAEIVRVGTTTYF